MRKAIPSLLAALSGITVALAAQQAAVPPQSPAAPRRGSEGATVEENVSFCSRLQLDVYQPSGDRMDRRPAVVLIHGGGWTSFDKSTMRGMGELLARFGFVAFAVDYRLFHGAENRWPAQLDDVQCAVRWIRANAGKYGVNPDRVGAFGHSAGAQLAALLGMEDTRDNSDAALAKYSSKVQAVVDVSGPTDFAAHRDPDDVGFLTSFLNGSYAEHPETWRDASPVFHVSKDDAPFLIVHGTQDPDVPISQSQELFDKLQAARVPSSFIKVNDVHTFHTPEARHELAIQTLAFFDRYLKH